MDNLSYSSEENMSGSNETCKDGTWHLEMRKEKQMILEKIAFYIRKKSKNKKNCSKTCDSTISEIFGNKVKKTMKTYQSH
jgi:hypothetical protein